VQAHGLEGLPILSFPQTIGGFEAKDMTELPKLLLELGGTEMVPRHLLHSTLRGLIEISPRVYRIPASSADADLSILTYDKNVDHRWLDVCHEVLSYTNESGGHEASRKGDT